MKLGAKTGTKFALTMLITFGVGLQAYAQNCGAGCGPRVGNSCFTRSGVGNCGPHGLKQYPLSEKRYINQFCGPHIAPESCFGYFKPQITRWSEACPNYIGEPEVYNPTISVAPTALPQETPRTEAPKTVTPKPETPKSQPLDAPKKAEPPVLPMIPKIEETPSRPPTTPIIPGVPKVDLPIIPPTVHVPSEVPVTLGGGL